MVTRRGEARQGKARHEKGSAYGETVNHDVGYAYLLIPNYKLE